jgi:transposase
LTNYIQSSIIVVFRIGGEIDMAVPMSMDLRKRIINARERGDSVAKIAREKEVTERAVYQLLARYKDTGSYAPLPKSGGRKSVIDEALAAEIKAKITERPDITLSEIIEEFKLDICVSAMCRIVKRLGFSYKKNPSRQRQIKTSRD